ELARVVRVEQGGDRAPVVGDAPLTPIQHWFFQTHPDRPYHFNQSVLAELTGELDEAALGRALDALVTQHDALRLRFSRVDGEWRQEHAEPGDDVLSRIDLSDVDSADLFTAMEKI